MRCAVLLASLTAASALRLPPAADARAAPSLGRRESLGLAAALGVSALGGIPGSAAAVAPKKVVVAGATGQTGRRVLERLAAKTGLAVIGGVRNPAKAEKDLASSSTVVRGAMVQSVGAIDVSSVTLAKLDVVKDSAESLVATLKGADALVVATGFVPGNPFEMGKEAHAVDNVGTIALVDAAKAAGVGKIVMVSSILTDADAWGQRSSPGFQVTNAFGGVLDEKLVAEKYLRASGLDFTIVRPGGLKAKPPTGALVVSGENTLNSGEVSRDLVADVVVAALFDDGSKNKVVEIFENETPGASAPPEGKWFYGLKM